MLEITDSGTNITTDHLHHVPINQEDVEAEANFSNSDIPDNHYDVLMRNGTKDRAKTEKDEELQSDIIFDGTVGNPDSSFLEMLDIDIGLRDVSTFSNSSTLLADNIRLPTIQQLVEEPTGHASKKLKDVCANLLIKIKKLLTRRTFISLIILYGSIPLSCLQLLMISALVRPYTNALEYKFYEGQEDKHDDDLNFSCGLSQVRDEVFSFIVGNLLPDPEDINAFAG